MKQYLALGLCLFGATAASAQSAPPVKIRVGAIAAAQECTVYEGVKASSKSRVAGAAGGYVNAYGAAGYAAYAASSSSTYETFFVKDCFSHFEGIRAAMQAALASSGSVIVGPGSYVLTGRVEDAVPIAGGYAERAPDGSSYGTVSKGMRVTMSVKVVDKAGRIVFGAPVVTDLETGSIGVARDTVNANIASGEGLYGLLQRQIAMVAARKVAFHFRPMVVTQGGGRKITLNYGSPLVEVGAMVSVTSPDGSNNARYRITSTSEGTAIAQQLGDADSGAIVPGSRALIIEKGDPAANQSVLERVELP
jgi:hypothetical protein